MMESFAWCKGGLFNPGATMIDQDHGILAPPDGQDTDAFSVLFLLPAKDVDCSWLDPGET